MKTIRIIPSLLLALALALPSLAATGCATAQDDAFEIGEESSEIHSRAKIDLYQVEGAYYFDLVSGNGRLLLASQGYQSRTDALRGLLSVLHFGSLPEFYRVAVDADGQPFLELRAGNHVVIATSDSYYSASNARRGIDACVRSIELYQAHWATATGARFEIFVGANDRHYFRLVARNGQQVLRSQSYASRASALNGAFAVAEYGVSAEAYDVRQANNGGYYFNVYAPNGQVIGTSQVYSTKYSATRGRDAIIALLPTIELL
jgi:uncharacterized protein